MPPDPNGLLCENLMELLKLSGAENNICVNVKINENEQLVHFHMLIIIYRNVKCEPVRVCSNIEAPFKYTGPKHESVLFLCFDI